MALINEEIKDDFKEKIYGCFLGAFVGDSCGSYLEFYGGMAEESMLIPSEEVLDKTMEMPGGGYHKVAPGQVTDDSEMMQCLIWGYIESNKDVAPNEPKKFDINAVGEKYGNWYKSDPFDIGQATTEALKALGYAGKTGQAAIERARTFNRSTKSNGSMMRCMPHALFGAQMVKSEKFQEFFDLISIEAQFVHANPIVHEANFVYLVALTHLLNNPDAGDRAQVAFDIA